MISIATIAPIAAGRNRNAPKYGIVSKKNPNDFPNAWAYAAISGVPRNTNAHELKTSDSPNLYRKIDSPRSGRPSRNPVSWDLKYDVYPMIALEKISITVKARKKTWNIDLTKFSTNTTSSGDPEPRPPCR